MQRWSAVICGVISVAFASCQLIVPVADTGQPGAPGSPNSNWDLQHKLSAEEALATLTEAGVRFRAAPVAPKTNAKGLTCHLPDGVRVTHGSTGIRYPKPLHVNAAFAVRILEFERIVQETAQKWLQQPVKQIDHLGTYVCRHVAGSAGTLSEHASGNAIDVSEFLFKNNVRVNVKRDYVRIGEVPRKPAEHFLQELVARLRSERTFGIILTPDWDKRHHNHLHLDGGERFSLWRLFS